MTARRLTQEFTAIAATGRTVKHNSVTAVLGADAANEFTQRVALARG
jgi:hypothetical protein